MPTIKYTEMYDDDHEPMGYLPMVYDDFERVHAFGFYGHGASNYELFDTPEDAQKTYENGGAFATSAYGCESCQLRRYRQPNESEV